MQTNVSAGQECKSESREETYCVAWQNNDVALRPPMPVHGATLEAVRLAAVSSSFLLGVSALPLLRSLDLAGSLRGAKFTPFFWVRSSSTRLPVLAADYSAPLVAVPHRYNCAKGRAPSTVLLTLAASPCVCVRAASDVRRQLAGPCVRPRPARLHPQRESRMEFVHFCILSQGTRKSSTPTAVRLLDPLFPLSCVESVWVSLTLASLRRQVFLSLSTDGQPQRLLVRGVIASTVLVPACMLWEPVAVFGSCSAVVGASSSLVPLSLAVR